MTSEEERHLIEACAKAMGYEVHHYERFGWIRYEKVEGLNRTYPHLARGVTIPRPAQSPERRLTGSQYSRPHPNSAASAARRTTRPGRIFPPPRTHFFSSTLAPSISPALIFRRKVEPASRVAPRL